MWDEQWRQIWDLPVSKKNEEEEEKEEWRKVLTYTVAGRPGRMHISCHIASFLQSSCSSENSFWMRKDDYKRVSDHRLFYTPQSPGSVMTESRSLKEVNYSMANNIRKLCTLVLSYIIATKSFYWYHFHGFPSWWLKLAVFSASPWYYVIAWFFCSL